jgi:large subunit ribosomal protein L24
MNSLNIRKGDTVVVLSGKDKGRQGKILSTLPKEKKVIVEGVNIATRHTKPRRQTDPGGIIKKESPLYVCKVMRVCPKCKKPTRTSHEIDIDGTKSRVCKRCGDII